jgi:hypothetical protein
MRPRLYRTPGLRSPHGRRPTGDGGAATLVGIDLGTEKTAFGALDARAADEAPRAEAKLDASVLGVPAGPGARRGAIARAAKETSAGAEALRRFQDLRVIRPWSAEPARRQEALGRCLESLARSQAWRRRGGTVDGVVAARPDLDEGGRRQLRAASHRVFDRVLLVEEPALLAAEIFLEHDCRSGIIADLGAASTRVYLFSGSAAAERRRIAAGEGGAGVERRLREALQGKHPDLWMSEKSLRALKERLGHVAPVKRRSLLELRLGGRTRTLDISAQVIEAFEVWADEVIGALSKAISLAPSDALDERLGNIFLVGGGAEVPGLARRLSAGLAARGIEKARIREVAEPRTMAARGALLWACLADRESWQVPVIRFGD